MLLTIESGRNRLVRGLDLATVDRTGQVVRHRTYGAVREYLSEPPNARRGRWAGEVRRTDYRSPVLAAALRTSPLRPVAAVTPATLGGAQQSDGYRSEAMKRLSSMTLAQTPRAAGQIKPTRAQQDGTQPPWRGGASPTPDPVRRSSARQGWRMGRERLRLRR